MPPKEHNFLTQPIRMWISPTGDFWPATHLIKSSLQTFFEINFLYLGNHFQQWKAILKPDPPEEPHNTTASLAFWTALVQHNLVTQLCQTSQCAPLWRQLLLLHRTLSTPTISAQQFSLVCTRGNDEPMTFPLKTSFSLVGFDGAVGTCCLNDGIMTCQGWHLSLIWMPCLFNPFLKKYGICSNLNSQPRQSYSVVENAHYLKITGVVTPK